jgi:hypothetical protein
MTGQEVERHITQTPVPQFLEAIGVHFLYDEVTNARIVAIPGEVRSKVNVIDPVTSLVQADPNWTPRISVCELNPSKDGPHYYQQAGGKLAPTKQALEVLAKGAGVLYTRTDRIPKAELDEGEIGYRATIGIRRSDGTVEELRREKVWVEAAERQEVEDAVTAARAYENGQRTNKPKWVPDSDEWRAEVQKRWLRELRDRYAKTESKAVLRAIRAALQIPHTFTPAEAAKPFLIVGFNFTPDYDDVEVKRMLVAAGLNAQAAMYGPSAPTERINTTTGEITSGADSPTTDAEEAAAPGDQQVEAAASDPLTPAAASAPDEDEPEPTLFGDQQAAEDADTPAWFVVPAVEGIGESWRGKTLSEIAAMEETDEKSGERIGEKWFAYVARNPAKYPPQLHAALQRFRPQLFEQKAS